MHPGWKSGRIARARYPEAPGPRPIRVPSVLDEFLDLFLPPSCARCRRALPSHQVLCATCRARLSKIPLSTCARCQQRPSQEFLDLCTTCSGQRSPLQSCRAAIWFEGDALEWIHDFKYPGRGLAGFDPRARAVVSELVVRAGLESQGPPPELVVPVPLHPRRLRERGFNPAALLARSLSRAWGVPCNPVALRRRRDTPSQTRLDRAARRANVRDAFRACGKQPSHVCLLDDVVTTGATLEAAARALHAAGSTRVTALCVARTPTPRTRRRD